MKKKIMLIAALALMTTNATASEETSTEECVQ